MANVFEYASVFQSELDKAAVEQATSGWMELNDKLVRYNGGAEVKIPSMDMDGLADYDRDKGFVEGSVNLKWETKEMTQDRGRQFTFDENEVNETNFVVTAAQVMGEFQRTKVIPEIDAYRYSKIASLCIAKERAGYEYTPTENDILKKLYYDIAAVQDVVGDETPLVITMARPVAAILDMSSTLSKSLSVMDFKQGDVTVKVKSLNGEFPIIRVGSGRMKTSYQFYDGTTSTQERAALQLRRMPRTSTGSSAPAPPLSPCPARTRCGSSTRRPIRRSGPGRRTTASTMICGCRTTS